MKHSHIYIHFLFILFLSFLFTESFSQGVLKGIVNGDKAPLPGSTIKLTPTNTSVISDQQGFFSFSVSKGIYTLTVTHVGFTKFEKEITVLNDSLIELEIELIPDLRNSDEILVLGSRSANRSSLNSPVPIDVLKLNDLRTTGQTTLDKMLQFKLPSFSTVNVPVSDATTLIDPYEIRNLGPTRTLVLVNGKRKNSSSLIYLFGVDRGETGADLSSIPTEAIKQVEVLRDGSSAQYGSDAIAGVINIVLKNDTSNQSIYLTTGLTHKGDGLSKQFVYQSGSSVGNKGSLNFTIDLSQTANAVRSGIIDPVSEKASFGGNPQKNLAIDQYLLRFPTANNLNGTGSNTSGKFLMNFEMPLSYKTNLYFNSSFNTKRVVSNANFRTPYWRTDFGLLHKRIPGAENYTGTNDSLYQGYLGYMPTFEGDMIDHSSTLGLKTKNGIWSNEASITYGGNKQLYTINNTINSSLGVLSPTSFKGGGFGFNQLVVNYDVNGKLSKAFNIAFGSEFRQENYQIYAGDTASYSGEGANSFPGINMTNQSRNSRYNLGVYTDMTWDISDRWLVNGAARVENYSDFGNAFVWKASTHYHTANGKIIFRGSLSTGFRAPTIHQLYYQLITGQYSDGTVTLGGIFKSRSKEVTSIDIPSLRPEQSKNFTIGIGLKPIPKMNLTLDFYRINISNRIILSSQLSTNDPNTILYSILKRSNIVSLGFFSNGINTNTEGMDMVFSYGPIVTSHGKLNFSFAGNITFKNMIVGAPIESEALRSSGISILNASVRSNIETGRPRKKFIGGVEYNHGKYTFNLNGTMIGSTSFQDIVVAGPIMEHISQKFKHAFVTDLNVSRNFRKAMILSVSINNILNAIPKWDLIPLDNVGLNYLSDPLKKQLLAGALTFNGRYRLTGVSGSQFSQLGTLFHMSIFFKL